ncbi:hypothetical protein H0H81_000385 [Sphagnurus paluster]|uniref:Uncharacterized protein n=1 Tax=Sphagnurus paluster TaxID=117069 RepID=A0A9P7FWH1_9AGAR|nr:hypothetical protein H0H81_000385 [Sphagnurus paluster]
MESTVSSSVSSYLTEVQQQTEVMSTTYSDAFDQHSRAKRARVEATTAMGRDVESEYLRMRNQIASTSRNIESVAGRVIFESSGLLTAMESYGKNSKETLKSLYTASEGLAEGGACEDASTGSTPRKHTWDYVDQWSLTKPRDAIVKNWRQQGLSNIDSETFLAEHLPIPEADGTEESLDSNLEVLSLPDPENIPSPTPAVPKPSRPTSKLSGHKKAPSVGTLTDARNVYTTRGSRRAR